MSGIAGEGATCRRHLNPIDVRVTNRSRDQCQREAEGATSERARVVDGRGKMYYFNVFVVR